MTIKIPTVKVPTICWPKKPMAFWEDYAELGTRYICFLPKPIQMPEGHYVKFWIDPKTGEIQDLLRGFYTEHMIEYWIAQANDPNQTVRVRPTKGIPDDIDPCAADQLQIIPADVFLKVLAGVIE